MSSEEHIPSNEEVVDELTKDLEKQFSVETQKDEMSSNKEDNTEPVVVQASSECDQKVDFDKSDSEDSGNESPSQELPDDYIDEVELKEIEANLTDAELEDRLQKALELKKEGNDDFKSEKYIESIATYTRALRTCPLKNTNERAIFYANRAASKIKANRKQSALEDCTKAIELNPNYVRAYLRRANLYENTEKYDESLADFKKVLEFDPGNPDALKASVRLPPLIEKRNEEMKEEMLSKLKDLGNMILRPFGLSTNNFQLQQDPNTGGYSINFQQNK